MPDNLQKMIRLAEEFFDMRNDPAQLSVNEEVMTQLKAIHPATLSEEANDDGPVAWILVIPTTVDLMERFVREEVSEADLYRETHPGQKFGAVYLCSALVLPEFRRKGLARKMTLAAIRNLQEDFPIRALYTWAFSDEGEKLGEIVAKESGLPLYKRPPGHPSTRGTKVG
jgi:ribosomal protein S18 acetylase RimI-like enzyme